MFSDQTVKDFFETQNNIYTLHAFLDIEPDRDEDVVRAALADFVRAYREAPTAEDKMADIDVDVAEYRKGASSRTRSKSSRSARVFALRNWIRKHLGEDIRDSSATT